MDKKDFFYKYTEFANLQNIGYTWVSTAKSYVPITQIVQEISFYQVLIWGLHIQVPTYLIVAGIILKTYVWMVINFIVGKFAKKIGIVQAQNEYNSKKEYLSPFNHQLKLTMENVCEKLGTKSEFTEL